MWVLISTDYCVVLNGKTYFVCRRVEGSKLECLYQCETYQEAYQAYRQASQIGSCNLSVC